MPSPLGHAIAGVAAGWLVAGAPRGLRDREASRNAGAFAMLGMLPDVDLLVGMHSGPTHGVGAAAIAGVLALVAARRAAMPRAPQFALACLAAYLSHALLDWLGTDASPPLGIMALWPFSRAYHESDLHVFMAISRRYYQGWTFVWQNVRAVALEVTILVPVLAVVGLLRRRGVSVTLVVAAGLGMVSPAAAAPRSQNVQSDTRTYPAVLALYGSGAIDDSLIELRTLLASSSGRQQIDGWIGNMMPRATRRTRIFAAARWAAAAAIVLALSSLATRAATR